MTPNELLESVKERFSVLLVDNDQQLTSLLVDSLRKYRDKAGVRNTLVISNSGLFELPSDFLAMSMIKDAEQDAIFASPMLAGGVKVVNLPNDAVYPLTLSYFVDLLKIGHNEELPERCIDLTAKHLQTQIERANDARIKQIESLADGDVSDLSTPAEKDAALAAIEQQMSSEMSFSDILTIQPLWWYPAPNLKRCIKRYLKPPFSRDGSSE